MSISIGSDVTQVPEDPFLCRLLADLVEPFLEGGVVLRSFVQSAEGFLQDGNDVERCFHASFARQQTRIFGLDL